jgi:hypothetical protein
MASLPSTPSTRAAPGRPQRAHRNPCTLPNRRSAERSTSFALASAASRGKALPDSQRRYRAQHLRTSKALSVRRRCPNTKTRPTVQACRSRSDAARRSPAARDCNRFASAPGSALRGHVRMPLSSGYWASGWIDGSPSVSSCRGRDGHVSCDRTASRPRRTGTGAGARRGRRTWADTKLRPSVRACGGRPRLAQGMALKPL